MKLLPVAAIAALATESAFALCLSYGETPDIDSGDFLGFVGWIAHLPSAMIVNLITPHPYQFYSDSISLSLFLAGLLLWIGCWYYILGIFWKRITTEKPV